MAFVIVFALYWWFTKSACKTCIYGGKDKLSWWPKTKKKTPII